MENKLIYVNGLGLNYKGDYIYEFIFSDTLDVWGEDWESEPASGRPKPPEIKYVTKVYTLKDTDLKFELAQNSDYFSMIDASDEVVALAWEMDYDENVQRLVFKFGETEKSVVDKLYARDIMLHQESEYVQPKVNRERTIL